MSGYSSVGIDLDEIFELLRSGDTKYTGDVETANSGIDLRDRYVSVVQGDRIPANMQYTAIGVNYREIFAAKGSVPRFSKPLPWNRSVSVSDATIYRQPSRLLSANVTLALVIQNDGRVSIVVSKPPIDSNPNGYTNSVIYPLTSTPAWNVNDIPAGEKIQVRFDIVSGSGATLQGSLAFGTWYDLDSSRVSANLIAKIVYNHYTDATGTKTTNCNVKVTVRRTDYPATNIADGTLSTILALNVLASLFSSTSNWTKDFSYILNGGAYNPEGNTEDYQVRTRYRIYTDGTLKILRAINDGSLATVSTTSWRRALGTDADIGDFQVRGSVVSGVAGGVLSDGYWHDILSTSTGYHDIEFVHIVGNDKTPGTYTQTAQANLEFRQKSTLNYSTLANFVSGRLQATTSIVITGPAELQWPSDFGWPDLSVQATETKNPGDEHTMVAQLTGAITPSGVTFTSYNTDGNTTSVVGSSHFVPAGLSAGDLEMKIDLNPSGTGEALVKPVGSGVWFDPSSANQTVSVKKTLFTSSDPTSSALTVNGTVSVRRKAYPSQSKSDSFIWKATVTLNEPLNVWDSSNAWRGATATEVRSYNQSAPDSGWGCEYRAVIAPDGTITYINLNRGTTEDVRRYLPVGYDPADYEMKISYTKISGTASLISSASALGTWRSLNSGTDIVYIVENRKNSEGPGVSSTTVEITMQIRNKSYPAQSYSTTARWTVSVSLQQSEHVLENPPGWAGWTWYNINNMEI